MLYRGGQPSAEGFETLAHMEIAIIVDTGRSKRDETLIKSLGMTYVSLPWYCPLPKDKVFKRFIEITRENPGKRIFVHCRLADDRTEMMIVSHGRTALDGERSHARDARIWLWGHTSPDLPRSGEIREELSAAFAERPRV
jgi:hypothetical protein